LQELRAIEQFVSCYPELDAVSEIWLTQLRIMLGQQSADDDDDDVDETIADEVDEKDIRH
jgi:hypothetical protein